MSIGLQRRLSYPREQLTESRIPGETAAQDQRVHEETNQAFGLHLGPSCDRRTDGNVFLPRVAREKRLECREQRHEQGRVLAASQLLEFLEQTGRKHRGERGSAGGVHRGAGPVGRQFEQIRDPRELLLP